jgi:hypothetical protein
MNAGRPRAGRAVDEPPYDSTAGVRPHAPPCRRSGEQVRSFAPERGDRPAESVPAQKGDGIPYAHHHRNRLHVFEGDGFGVGGVVGRGAGAVLEGLVALTVGAGVERPGRPVVGAGGVVRSVAVCFSDFLSFGDSDGDAEAGADAEVASGTPTAPLPLGRPVGCGPSVAPSPAAAVFGVAPGASIPSSARPRPPAASSSPAPANSTRRLRLRCTAALRSRRAARVPAPRSVPPCAPRRRLCARPGRTASLSCPPDSA